MPETSFAKVAVTATLVVETGLHIGTGGAFSAIGAIDSPVVRDPLSKMPMIPGSSLKGKMRSLLAKEYNPGDPTAAQPGTKDSRTANGDAERIKRLFGSSQPIRVARLIFRDSVLSNDEDLRKHGAAKNTEIKYENTIDRLTAEANPRQIERVLRGSEFDFELIYEVSTDPEGRMPSREEVCEDIETLTTGLTLLTYDYLGGHGTRGYGRVSFRDAQARELTGELPEGLLSDLNSRLTEIRSK